MPLADPRIEAALSHLVDAPHDFYAASTAGALYGTLEDASVALFAAAKESEPAADAFGPLDELLVDGFDADQIWEQMQLLNEGLLNHIEFLVDELGALQQSDMPTMDDEPLSDDADDVAASDVDSVGANDDVDDEIASVADSSDSELAATADDANDDDGSDNDVDVDDGDSDDYDEDDIEGMDGHNMDEEAASMSYKEFFGDEAPDGKLSTLEREADLLDEEDEDAEAASAPLSSQVADLFQGDGSDMDDLDDDDNADDLDLAEDGDDRMDLDVDDADLDAGDDDEEDEDGFIRNPTGAPPRGPDASAQSGAPQSTFERQNADMTRQIEMLEFESIQAKKWSLRGEVSSSTRPINSLLEEDILFDTVSKPVPIVSEEFTMSLEDRIKDRILKKEFNDVVRKIKLDAPVYRPREEVSSERSKQSLAELYEGEYLKSVGENKSSAVVEALTEQHKEIEELERDLFYKLDALSSFFYAPKPVMPEIAVKHDVAALTMEEAIPAFVSDAATKAPEEVYKKQATLKSRDEMSSSEKQAVRKVAKAKKAQTYRDRTKSEETIKSGRAGKHQEAQRAIKQLLADKNVTILDGKGQTSQKDKNKRGQSSGTKLRL
ncbi:U3 small nucleolar ribonucleoprotein complex, subunit Mpp10 [Blastocladiella britannica]|nr:U3 small nucleolar ribonucleoprotein complex, subunit Mpp10 [Blastocladiella britannica]